jgi:PST family polysaccharide transporter
MRFSVTATIDLCAEVLGMVFAVVAALMGAGLWALVIQRLSYAALVMIGTWSASGWLPGRPQRTSGVGPLLSFGFSVTGNGIANLIARNLDQVLIGWYWNPRLLGFYERAYKLCMNPLNNITGPLYSVGMPALSRLSHDRDRYRSAYIALAEKLAMVSMPGLAFVVASSDWVVRVMLGAQWGDAAPILAWLGFGAMLLPVVNATGLLFVSQDRTPELLHVGLIGSAISAVAIVIGLPFGPIGVAAAFALAMNFLRIPFCFWMAGRRGPVTIKDLYLPLIPSTVAAIVVFAAVSALHHVPALETARPITSFIAAGLTAVLCALLCFLSMERSRRALMFFGTLGRAMRYRKAAI